MTQSRILMFRVEKNGSFSNSPNLGFYMMQEFNELPWNKKDLYFQLMGMQRKCVV